MSQREAPQVDSPLVRHHRSGFGLFGLFGLFGFYALTTPIRDRRGQLAGVRPRFS